MEGSGVTTHVAFSKVEVEQLFKRIRALTDLSYSCWMEWTGRDEWAKSPLDPMKFFDAATGRVWVKSGYTLRAYYHGGMNAYSQVFAARVNDPFPDPIPARSFLGFRSSKLRLPLGALTDFMKIIDGDHSPWSYLVASLLRRELKELGNTWHRLAWKTHDLLYSPPQWYLDISPTENAENRPHFTMLRRFLYRPEEWLPVFDKRAGICTLRFCTYSDMSGTIFRHLDEYAKGDYQFSSVVTPLARSGEGYIF
jgi:hypothetical protein